jgi:hypothetical protein
MVMGGAITAVAAIITAGAEAAATTMVGGTITIGDLICQSEEAASVGRPLSLPIPRHDSAARWCVVARKVVWTGHRGKRILRAGSGQGFALQ